MIRDPSCNLIFVLHVGEFLGSSDDITDVDVLGDGGDGIGDKGVGDDGSEGIVLSSNAG